MSHLIKERDTVSATKSTWHGLEHLKDQITRQNAGNAFQVGKRPVKTQLTETSPLIKVPGFEVIVNLEDGHPLTVCHKGYQIIQNEWMWTMAEAIQAATPCKVTCAGTLANQLRAFVSIELEQEWKPLNERWLQNINIVNSFDTSTAFELYDSATRIVCDNTLQMSRMQALRESGLLFKIVHLGQVDQALHRLLTVVEDAMRSRTAFEAKLERLANQTVHGEKVILMLASQLAVKQPDKSHRLTNHAAKGMVGICGLFYRGIGCQGSTFYDLLNAGTQWWSHGDGAGKVEPGQSEQRRFANSEFGTASKAKPHWADTLCLAVQSDEYLDKLCAQGEQYLEEAGVTVKQMLDLATA